MTSSTCACAQHTVVDSLSLHTPTFASSCRDSVYLGCERVADHHNTQARIFRRIGSKSFHSDLANNVENREQNGKGPEATPSDDEGPEYEWGNPPSKHEHDPRVRTTRESKRPCRRKYSSLQRAEREVEPLSRRSATGPRTDKMSPTVERIGGKNEVVTPQIGITTSSRSSQYTCAMTVLARLLHDLPAFGIFVQRF